MADATRILEKQYGTVEAGTWLDLHPRDVRRLIKSGRLRAKRRNLRGTGKQDHYLIPESALIDYVASLPDAVPVQSSGRQPRVKQTHPGQLAGVKQWVS
jgi:hypothetical protein